MKRTKIIATIGPASEDDKILKQLLVNGVDLCRFNLKHNTLGWHENCIKKVVEISKEIEKEIGIIVDLPKKEILPDWKEVDFFALSYLTSSQDVTELKELVKSKGLTSGVIAKIENKQALDDLENIVEVSDGIMIARGDLGIAVPLEELAYWQKKIIDLCRLKNKPVIVATQMLLSMVSNPSPTRAEATDVANAVFDGADALMLSEETAIGKYGEKAVEEMSRIIVFCEDKNDVKQIIKTRKTPTEILISAAANIINDPGSGHIKGAIIFSQSGSSARILSAYRLKIPLVVISDNIETCHGLKLTYGVTPYYRQFDNKQFMIEGPIFEELVQKGLFKSGDQIIAIHGNNWINMGTTSDISLKTL